MAKHLTMICVNRGNATAFMPRHLGSVAGEYP